MIMRCTHRDNQSRSQGIAVLACLALFLTFAVAGCGGGGSTATTTANASLSGSVVDGKVSGAKLTIYSDAHMTNQIGSGTTDSTGRFKITLTVKTAPDPIYIKSVGGTDLDTGMPAPTMFFVGNTAGANALTSFNITPLTTRVCVLQHGRGMTLANAQTQALQDFGLKSLTGAGGLYEDPTAAGQTALQQPLYQALSTGTMLSSIPVGNYQLFAIAVSETSVNATAIAGIADVKTNFLNTGSLTVDAQGNITGTLSGGTGVIRGIVKGDALILNIMDQATNPTSITRVVGHVGLHGAVAGDFTDISGLGTNPVMHKGVFVATLIPKTGVNMAKLATFIQNFYTPGATTGKLDFMARDVFGPPPPANGCAGVGCFVPRIRWGQMAVTAINPAKGTVTVSNMSVIEDSGSTAVSAPMTLTAGAGEYIVDATTGLPTDLLVFQYTTPAPGNASVYIISAVGLRRGLYIVVPPATPGAAPVVESFGEAYLDKVNHPPVYRFTPGATYDIATAAVHVALLGQSRTQALNWFAPVGSTFTVTTTLSGGTTSFGYVLGNNTTQDLMVFAGGMYGTKLDVNNDFLDNMFGGGNVEDHMRLVEFFESGAFQGDEILGGSLTVNQTTYLMRNYPDNFVGFAHKQGDPTPSFTGTRHFLARTMYATNYAGFQNTYSTGTLSITAPTTTAGSATLSFTNAGGVSGTATLTVDKPAANAPGLYHMHGPLGQQYIDLVWPIGGTRALWIASSKINNVWTVQEVGEAYITP